MTSQARPITAHHEWGKLREVIVGRGEDLVMPGFSEAVSFIYDPQFIDVMKTRGGCPAQEIEPERTAKVIAQIDHLAEVLAGRGIIVHRSHRLAPAEREYMDYVQQGGMLLYARDPMLVVGDHVIETVLKVPMRAKERFAVRPIIRERLAGSGARYVAMPPASPSFGEDNLYLEGGDVLLNGYDVYVGNSGRASNPAGIAWLQATLGAKYRVHEVKLTDAWEHLDCVLALVRPGLGIICREGFVEGLPESIRDWDYVEVSLEEAKHLAANCLVLDEHSVIIDEQHHRIGQELARRGVEVIEIPYDAVATWGGAFRCSHHPLWRESALD